MKRLTNRWRLGVVLGTLVLLTAGVSASQALATIPHSVTGVITACSGSNGALRVIDAQQGATCAAGETQLAWNGTTISATQWGSGAVVPFTRGGGVAQVVLRQPGNQLPAGSWLVTTEVMIANSQEIAAFRCWTQTRGTLSGGGGQVQEWGGTDGWHDTMVIPGMVTMTQPDWIDVYCSHDQNMSSGGWVQVESVRVIVQRVAAAF